MKIEHDDLLIHRAVSLTADDADWDAIERRRGEDPALDRALVAALRDQGALARAAIGLETIAASVEASAETPARARAAALIPRVFPWAGWIAAAVLAAVALIPDGAPAAPASPSPVPALATELPRILLETRRDPSGRVEVLYLQPILERETLDGLFEVGIDDLGRPVPTPVDLAWLASATRL